jgi:penicillin amidase
MSSQDVKQGDLPARPTMGVAGDPAAEDVTVPRVRRRRWRRLVPAVLAVLLAIVLVASGLVVWTVRRSFPQLEGKLTISGLAAPVTVLRDRYGVPQLYATSESDLFRAQGYVHAQDRFWEMDFRRHISAGRLAELFGAGMVPTDAFLRTLGWRAIAEREWQMISPESRRRLQDYADGVNAWLTDNGGSSATGKKSLEYAVLGLQNSVATVEPWHPIDSLAWLKIMAWDLSGNMEAEINRSALLAGGLSPEQVGQLYPPYPYARNRPIVPDRAPPPAGRTPPAPSGSRGVPAAASVLGALGGAVRALPGRLGHGGGGIGSNSWVVHGSLTAGGRPLLVNDPHLLSSMPGVWYQIGLRCECPYQVAGFSLTGVPGVLIGHNGRVAWGMTNLGPDVTDLYLERVEGSRYLDGSGWRPLATREEIIEVAGADPVRITVRSTGHGPLLSDRSTDLLNVAGQPPVTVAGTAPEPAGTPSLDAGAPGVPSQATASPYAAALRMTALDPGRTVDALFGLNTASGWDEFRAAAALVDSPPQSFVYTDTDGNIGYQATGRIPMRGTGDGALPAPGWDPAYDWTGYIPFAELPHAFNPPERLLVTANQAVAGPRYPHHMTVDWSRGYRSERVHEMLTERSARGKLTLEDMREMLFDNRNGFAPVLVPALLAVPLDGGSAPAKARELLRGWDFQQPSDSPSDAAAAAAFYNSTWRHLLLRTFDELPPDREPTGDDRWWEVVRGLLTDPTSPWWDDRSTPRTERMEDILRAALHDATAELTGRLGDNPAQWRWGDLHTLALRSESLGQSGITPIDWLFNRGPVRVAGGGGIVNATNWSAADGYEVDSVPSMRMIIDVADLDASRWVNLTGNSGHAFHRNYADQIELWRSGQDTPMRWARRSVETDAEHVLTLEPTRSG